MARSIIQKTTIRDAFLIVIGSFIYALGVACFQIPYGLAAGGVTGLATVIHAALLPSGINFPVGTQTILFNVFLLIPVFRSGGMRYAIRTVAGILASGFFVDLLAPLAPHLPNTDLLLCAIWGGVISGFGLGLVFRSGGNTGGMDIIAQLLSKKTSMSIGMMSTIFNAFVIIASIPVFSLRNALYAIITMVLMTKIMDTVIDGLKTERAAYIISTEHAKIANAIMYEMGRGVTEISARGVWSGNQKPMLFVVLGRRELGFLKAIVANIDPDAVVIVSEVHEVFGEGFKSINPPS